MSRSARAAATVSSEVVTGAPSGRSGTALPPARSRHALDHQRLEPAGAGLVFAHLAGTGDDLDVLAQTGEAGEGQLGAPRRLAHGAERERAAQDVGRRRCP